MNTDSEVILDSSGDGGQSDPFQAENGWCLVPKDPSTQLCFCLDLGCEVEYASPLYLLNTGAESGEGGIISLAQEAFWEGALYFILFIFVIVC